MAKIGIFGGSFNPPHIGHISGAICAMQTLKLNKLILMPTGHTPGKAVPEGTPSAEHRLAMLSIAASSYPKMEVSDYEIRNSGDCYTRDTISYFKSLYPHDRFVLIMGSDMFSLFPKWIDADKIAALSDIAVLSRGDKRETAMISETADVVKAMGGEIMVIPNETVAISSTQLRRLMAFESGESFLPKGVADYIRANRLYHTADDWKHLPMEKLEPIVISLLNPNRVRHVLGCRDTAVALAERWGANIEDAARAGILHDITKALDGPLQLTLCASYGKILSDFSKKYPKTLHALTGSLVAERIFGENESVVSAICHHTTGKADMSLLEMIIYVADYMEPNRDFPGVERLRELAFTDIRAALKLGLEMTLEHLKNQGNEVSPESRDALAFLNQ